MLARYDQLTDTARRSGLAAVLTHGEPHPGNTMRTADGWRLIDWDMVLLAPAERDLWWLDLGAGSMLAAYADAASRAPRPDLLELYRLRWDLADLAEFGAQLTGPHPGNDDDAKSFGVLESLVARAERDYG